jgi:hypothetical protein
VKKLESKLKRLYLKVPSGSLDSRVLSQKPLHSTQPARERWRVPVWVTSVIAVATGLAGFVGGVALRSGERTTRQGAPSPVNVQVIYDSPGSRNPFDFTRASHFFPGSEMETSATKLQPTA